jgi:hypothetical protein
MNKKDTLKLYGRDMNRIRIIMIIQNSSLILNKYTKIINRVYNYLIRFLTHLIKVSIIKCIVIINKN